MHVALSRTNSPNENGVQHDPLSPDEAPPDEPQLTPRQAAFAAHYVACGNGAEAARRAGYSVASARYAARDNLQDTRIRQRIRSLAAAQEAARRDEATYLLMMLNAAMEMALTRGQPNTMIRALAQMARITGLDRPSRPSPQAADDDEAEGDAGLALSSTFAPGLLQDALASSQPATPQTAPREIAPAPPEAGFRRRNGDASSAAAPTYPHIPPHPEDLGGARLPHPPCGGEQSDISTEGPQSPGDAANPSIHPLRGHSG